MEQMNYRLHIIRQLSRWINSGRNLLVICQRMDAANKFLHRRQIDYRF